MKSHAPKGRGDEGPHLILHRPISPKDDKIIRVRCFKKNGKGDWIEQGFIAKLLQCVFCGNRIAEMIEND